MKMPNKHSAPSGCRPSLRAQDGIEVHAVDGFSEALMASPYGWARLQQQARDAEASAVVPASTPTRGQLRFGHKNDMGIINSRKGSFTAGGGDHALAESLADAAPQSSPTLQNTSPPPTLRPSNDFGTVKNEPYYGTVPGESARAGFLRRNPNIAAQAPQPAAPVAPATPQPAYPTADVAKPTDRIIKTGGSSFGDFASVSNAGQKPLIDDPAARANFLARTPDYHMPVANTAMNPLGEPYRGMKAPGAGQGVNGSFTVAMATGGDLRTGMGGNVPGEGHGDKIPAKYEPGEFVVSNDMLDAEPGLRGHLNALREEVLADKGMTPAEADAKAIHPKGLRAEVAGQFLLDDLTGEPMPYTDRSAGAAARSTANDAEILRNAAANPNGPRITRNTPLTSSTVATATGAPTPAKPTTLTGRVKGLFTRTPSAPTMPADPMAAAQAEEAAQWAKAGKPMPGTMSARVDSLKNAVTGAESAGARSALRTGANVLGRAAGVYQTGMAVRHNGQALGELYADDKNSFLDKVAGTGEAAGNIAANVLLAGTKKFPVAGPMIQAWAGDHPVSDLAAAINGRSRLRFADQAAPTAPTASTEAAPKPKSVAAEDEDAKRIANNERILAEANAPAKLGDTRNIDEHAGTMEVFTAGGDHWRSADGKPGWHTVYTPEKKAQLREEQDRYDAKLAADAATSRADTARQLAYFDGLHEKENEAHMFDGLGPKHRAKAMQEYLATKASLRNADLNAQTQIQTTGMNNAVTREGNEWNYKAHMAPIQVAQQQRAALARALRATGGDIGAATKMLAGSGYDTTGARELWGAETTNRTAEQALGTNKAKGVDALFADQFVYTDKNGVRQIDKNAEALAKSEALRASGGKLATLDPDQQAAHAAEASDYVRLLKSARDHQNNSLWQKYGLGLPDAQWGGLPTQAQLKGGKLVEVGAWDGATSANLGRGDYRLTMPNGTTMHFGRNDLTEAQLNFLAKRGVDIGAIKK